MRDSRDIVCCMLVLGSAEVPRRCWPSCSLSCWRCIDALPWMPFTGGSRSWGIRNCEKSWGLGHPGTTLRRCACCWLQFHSSDDHGLPILNHFKFEPSNFLSQPPLGVLWLSFFCLALNTSLIVLLGILGTGSIKSNMPRYSAQIRQYRAGKNKCQFFEERFLHQTIH